MQDDAYEEFECDEDPTWSPEEIEDACKKLKEDDDSVKTHQNPRYPTSTIELRRGRRRIANPHPLKFPVPAHQPDTRTRYMAN